MQKVKLEDAINAVEKFDAHIGVVDVLFEKAKEALRALQTIVQTPEISAWLVTNDPQALEQVFNALGINVEGPFIAISRKADNEAVAVAETREQAVREVVGMLCSNPDNDGYSIISGPIKIGKALDLSFVGGGLPEGWLYHRNG